MEIKTRFKVGDLVQRKFERTGKDMIVLLEVMEVITQTCYAETQVFYLTNAVIAQKEYDHQCSKEGDFEWKIGHAISKEDNGNGWRKHREDVLIEPNAEEIEVITSNK